MKSVLSLPIRRLFASRTRVVYSVAVAACALLAACDSKETTAPPVLTTMTISPNPQTLAVGATQQFTVAGKDASGAAIATTPTWSVTGGGGTISTSGLFTAGTTPGTFTNSVVATSGGVTGTATVTVTAGALASFVITPANDTTIAGRTKQFTAVGRDAAGNTVTATPVWSIANGGGTISATGLFTAGPTAGSFPGTIRVTSGTITASANTTVIAGTPSTLVVTPATATLGTSATQQYVATARDSAGNVVTITPTWSVTAGGGTISATGLFTAGTTSGVFTNTVRATSGALTGSATVTITPGALASISVAPTPASVAVGATLQLTATGKDGAGNTIAITPKWSVVNGGGVIDSTTGMFTAGATPGVYANTIRVTSGSIASTISVTVTSGALAAMTITPAAVTLGLGATQQFTAVGRDAAGNAVVITPVWSITASGGSIDATTGLFTAGTTPGTFTNTVRATSGTIIATASVTVASGALATITVSPSSDTTLTSGVRQFTAVGRDAAGNVVALTPVWSVVNGGGTINSTTGVFTAGTTVGTYNNTIRATSGLIIGSANVTVNSNVAIVRTITVTPGSPVLAPGATQQFIATARDSAGTIIPIAATWSAVNSGGSISNTGLFTAGTLAGTYTNTVRATFGSVSGTSTVIVAANGVAPTVSLGTASANALMAGTTVSCVNGGIITGDVSVSPGSSITGFGPCAINGATQLGNASAAQAQLDLTTAYNALVGMTCPAANTLSNTIGNNTSRLPGVYCSTGAIAVNGTLTLDGAGDVNATWVFQAGTTVTGIANIVLINGAQARNVFWVAGSSAIVGAGSQWHGNIIALTNITLQNDATVFGRVLARNGSVTLGLNNRVTTP